MKNNVFKYKNGKFTITEGYGSVKRILQEGENDELIAFFKSLDMEYDNSAEVIYSTIAFFEKENINFDSSLDPSVWEIDFNKNISQEIKERKILNIKISKR